MMVNVHSYYSLRYGLLSAQELVQWVVAAENPSAMAPAHLCLTDINCTNGMADLMRAVQQAPHLRAHVGVDVRNAHQQLYVLLAQNEHGFANINRFLTEHLLHGLDFPQWAPVLEHVWVVYPWRLYAAAAAPPPLHPMLRIGVQVHELAGMRLGKQHGLAKYMVAMATGTFRNVEDMHTHRLLRCMDNNCLISKLPPAQAGGKNQMLRTVHDMAVDFADAPILMHNLQAMLETCHFAVDFKTNKNRKVFGRSAEEDFRQMTELAFEGLRYRYPQYNFATKQRLEKEMQLIYELGFTSYFLISWDICRFARHKGFYYVGRGSGANSMVAYCLQITDVDPIDLDLYFERFINPYRSSPPDFDLDFSWQDRDQVTAYILQKYGKEHAALLGTYNTFQSRAVVRELGKVFGLPKAEIDHLLDKPTYYSPTMLEETVGEPLRRKSGVYSAPGIGQREALPNKTNNTQGRHTIKTQIMHYAHRIHNLPNYRSIHVGGILISDLPLYYYSALEMPPKGFQTVQFSMLEAEDLGLAKFDILSQRGLGHIKDTIQLVQQKRGQTIDIHRIQAFKNDPKIARLIATGHTTGCFYVESPAMRQLLRKLRCQDYLTLVAASSVIRPGVARSGMMRTYIERHIDPAKRSQAHPVLQEIMPDTYGIMVYQEDVIKVAHHFAGLGLAESDVLRRGMSGKFRSRAEFDKVKERFFELCQQKGHSQELSQQVWHQIESFAGYSFAKGHSASYAVESYQSLHLKAYYPLEFYTAVINNFGGFYRTEFYVHAARMCGAQVCAPCINHSLYLTDLQEGNRLQLGFVHVASLEKKLAQRLLLSRQEHGKYTSIFDLKERLEPGLEQLKILIQVGALACLGKTKKELLWEAHWLCNKTAKKPTNAPLFKEPPAQYSLPTLEHSGVEDAFDQIELLGFALSSPFALVDTSKADVAYNFHRASQLRIGAAVSLWGYLVTVKPTRTVNGQEMNFGTWIDEQGHYFDTVHFPPALRAHPFKGRGVYLLQGTVTDDFGVRNIEVRYMQKLAYKVDPRWED